MSQPTPALVTQRGAERLPRLVLLLFCAAYVLPGLFGRDPWRNADLTAYGYMLAMAEGRTPWLAPTLGGLPAETALLPHWLGAVAIQGLSPWLEPALAARLPFALLLALTLALVWYSTFQLARTEAAQPVAFAFGGEAQPTDYARALADGALLACMACLGLLQLGHETTPELMQLSEVALMLWALAAAPFKPRWSLAAAGLALLGLASSGAPAIALALGGLGTLICWRSGFAPVRRLAPALLLLTAGSAALAAGLGAWHWRISPPLQAADWLGAGRLLLWFTWPVWPLALWTIWRWRHHWQRRHIAIPLSVSLVGVCSSLAMGGQDRALMLALPGLAVLAAFALPTFQRSTAAAMDWFSVFFFSLSALAIWVITASMHLGVPAKPLANIQRLAPGFEPQLSWLALLFAAAGTLAWLWLVRWRTARHRHPLWKSLVLPASGVALAWLLTMTLLLPVLDYARSARAWVAQVSRLVPAGQCVRAPGMARPQVAALEALGRYRVRADLPLAAEAPGCSVLILQQRSGRPLKLPEGWKLLGQVRRPTDRSELTLVLRRQP